MKYQRKTDRVIPPEQRQRMREHFLRIRPSLADQPDDRRKAIAANGGHQRWSGTTLEQRKAAMQLVRSGRRSSEARQ